MTEMILPGTYISVRSEGLIVPGRVSVNTIGIVGTASKGLIGVPVVLGNYLDARAKFGEYDPWIDGSSGELTLVRALELAYAQGANSVIAMRVSATDAGGEPTAESSSFTLRSPGGDNVRLSAKTPGTWGQDLEVKVETPAGQPAYVEDEEHDGGAAISLAHTPVFRNARNRVRLFTAASGVTRSLAIIYEDVADAPTANQVKIDRNSGALTFNAPLAAEDRVTVSYVVDPASAAQVTLRLGRSEEVYTVVNGDDLAADINRSPGGSAWVTAETLGSSGELLDAVPDFSAFGTGTNQAGSNGADAAASDYKDALDRLFNEPVHIMVAAGQDESFADELNAHCQAASTDAIRGDRIGVIGSRLGASLDDIRGHTMDSDRLIYVVPGLKANDAAGKQEVDLPGAYTAAAVAGLLASLPAHVSPTNKTLSIGGLEEDRVFNSAELAQLVSNRVLAIEKRQGFRIVKGVTTSTNTAWTQITTRRIVDYAKYGVRSACSSYIGLLNNERVRTALHTTITSFLNQMVLSEMLISFDLTVSATREEERQGIVQVTMVLRPVFSIDYIVVTMFLE